ncbi:MAG: ComF family protein [Methanoregula sp.]|nr:ComF family protein [Methanoregula sp.]
MKVARQLLKDFFNLLFPPMCAVCRSRLDARKQQNLCPRCSGNISYLTQPLCRICGMELAGGAGREYLCGECLRMPPAFHLARSLVRYETAVKQLVQKLKYGGDTSVTHGISDIIRGAQLTEFADCDWIIPVPLHVDRHRSRGLNQATILAGLFFPEKIPLIRSDWLVRTRNTTAQTRLGGLARRKNLLRAFEVRPCSQLDGTVVCLVDDVYTTGTTVGECAQVLVHHGAMQVKVLTLARAAVPQRGRVR